LHNLPRSGKLTLPIVTNTVTIANIQKQKEEMTLNRESWHDLVSIESSGTVFECFSLFKLLELIL